MDTNKAKHKHHLFKYRSVRNEVAVPCWFNSGGAWCPCRSTTSLGTVAQRLRSYRGSDLLSKAGGAGSFAILHCARATLHDEP